MLVDQRLDAALHDHVHGRVRARCERPSARPPARGVLRTSCSARSRRWPTTRSTSCARADVLWAGVGCTHAFYNRTARHRSLARNAVAAAPRDAIPTGSTGTGSTWNSSVTRTQAPGADARSLSLYAPPDLLNSRWTRRPKPRREGGEDMPRKIVDTILPTTMVGSYPRPHWYHHQLLGRDVRVAFKDVGHAEAYDDATQAVDPRSGGGRARHRHRRPDVVRRLRRRDRLVLLVHVRAHPRLRAGQGAASRPRSAPRPGRRRSSCSPTGAASSTAARSKRGPDPPDRPLQDRRRGTRPGRSRSPSAPARSTSPGTSTSSTTRTPASSATRWRRSSTPR